MSKLFQLGDLVVLKSTVYYMKPLGVKHGSKISIPDLDELNPGDLGIITETPKENINIEYVDVSLCSGSYSIHTRYMEKVN